MWRIAREWQLHDRATADAWLSKVRRRSRVTPRTRIESATSRSTSATDTDVRDDAAVNRVAVLLAGKTAK